jgi:hypothetical protein
MRLTSSATFLPSARRCDRIFCLFFDILVFTGSGSVPAGIRRDFAALLFWQRFNLRMLDSEEVARGVAQLG